MPVDQSGEDAAQEDADAAAAGGDKAEDPHRLRTLGRLREQGHHQGERNGGGDGTAEALHGAGGDEHPLRRRDPARERGEREQGDAGEEESPVAEEVAEPPPEEQEAAVREQVRVDDPRQRALGEAEILPDRRQRHVHDRHVENDHQAAQAEDVQGEPAGAVIGDGHRWLPFRSFVIDIDCLDPASRRNSSVAGPMISRRPDGLSSDGHP